MIGSFLAVYLVVQTLTLAVLPCTLRLFADLADRGYAFAKSLGILLGGFVLWFGVSYGLLRNETGGAWLAVIAVATISWVVGWPLVRQIARGKEEAASALPNWRYVLLLEGLFLLAFALWAWVRAHDPAANHTEQPMDLMFMNSIWYSPTYPPQDAWLAGYAISYYYFGYWLLTFVGRLAGQPPAIIYNVGQACWYGLLLIGCFGVGYNLLAHRRGDAAPIRERPAFRLSAALGGLLAALAVGVTGNLQAAMEWLHANGANISGLASLFKVYNFPQNAAVTNLWHIGNDWWWWRSSRVIEDQNLLGQHIEVIDEFPIFSYVLGDNHPHVIAMPFVVLVIALAWNYFLARPAPPQEETGEGGLWAALIAITPLGLPGLLLTVVAAGALVFLNTWDFPPYWLLLTLAVFTALLRHLTARRALLGALLFAGLLAAGIAIVYLPYFLTAQSQAGGFLPNLINPTRFPQFALMFGFGLLALIALVLVAWFERAPTLPRIGISLAASYGLPLFFLVAGLATALGTARGRQVLAQIPLPEGATSVLPFVLQRWTAQGLTFLILGALIALIAALIWQRWSVVAQRAAINPESPTFFALLLAAVGLLLIFAPEFVYLRDNFGTRMNTIFKFYYQGWLLVGLASAYTIVSSFRLSTTQRLAPALLSGSALLLISLGLIYPVTAVYSKTGGFSGNPTFDATAYIAQESPAEFAALAWIRANTAPDARVLEGKGASYRANYNRVSTATGRPTLLGWDGHEAQWRGDAYGEMADMRPELLEAVYQRATGLELRSILAEWEIDFVYVGPTERREYAITPRTEERLRKEMDLVFEQDGVLIFRRRMP